MRKILILENGDESYRPLFEEHGEVITDAYKVEGCDLVVFTGGADISPHIYGDIKLDTTRVDNVRDQLEWHTFNIAQILAIPMVGICRGMQFLNVMNGGPLIQDIDNHTNCEHEITTKDGDTFVVTGDHHQMCIPKGNYELLAWSTPLSSKYLAGSEFIFSHWQDATKEPEAIYWPNTNSFGVQYHPEWMDEDSRGYEYFQELLDTYVFNNW